MNFKLKSPVDGDDLLIEGVVFAEKPHAKAYADSLRNRLLVDRRTEVVDTADAATYTYAGNNLEPVK
jgi:hypothetical protein